MIRRRGDGLGFVSVFYTCGEKEHAFGHVEGTTSPALWRCSKCGAWAFVRRKGTRFRNGRPVAYRCSTSQCKRVAKIRSRYRATAGMYEWACTPAHAQGSRFEGVDLHVGSLPAPTTKLLVPPVLPPKRESPSAPPPSM